MRSVEPFLMVPYLLGEHSNVELPSYSQVCEEFVSILLTIKTTYMEGTWMVFYREIDYQHYLYNGTKVIAINPQANISDQWYHDEDDKPQHKAKLDQALHSKARGFAALARYQIVIRGTFISE